MRMAAVPDGAGGITHRLMPAPAKGRRKARPARDPIKANPDASAQTLRQLIERCETLMDEIAEKQEDLREVFGEAKATGFDTRVVKDVLTRRKKDRDALREHDDILQTYLCALGMD